MIRRIKYDINFNCTINPLKINEHLSFSTGFRTSSFVSWASTGCSCSCSRTSSHPAWSCRWNAWWWCSLRRNTSPNSARRPRRLRGLDPATSSPSKLPAKPTSPFSVNSHFNRFDPHILTPSIQRKNRISGDAARSAAFGGTHFQRRGRLFTADSAIVPNPGLPPAEGTARQAHDGVRSLLPAHRTHGREAQTQDLATGNPNHSNQYFFYHFIISIFGMMGSWNWIRSGRVSSALIKGRECLSLRSEAVECPCSARKPLPCCSPWSAASWTSAVPGTGCFFFKYF